MSHKQFLLAQRYLHFNDPQEDQDPSKAQQIPSKIRSEEENPLYKVQPLIERIQSNCISKYTLYQHVSVDKTAGDSGLL